MAPDGIIEINQLKEFKKFDNDKIMLELIDPTFEEGIGKILTFGAKKYDVDNWKLGNTPEDRQRYIGALLRHVSAYRKGEITDPDSGESHLYHAACNLMFLDYFDKQK